MPRDRVTESERHRETQRLTETYEHRDRGGGKQGGLKGRERPEEPETQRDTRDTEHREERERTGVQGTWRQGCQRRRETWRHRHGEGGEKWGEQMGT